MRIKSVAIAAGLVITTESVADQHDTMSLPVNQVAQSVVQVIPAIVDSMGVVTGQAKTTGFLVEGGLLVTNYGLLANCDTVMVIADDIGIIGVRSLMAIDKRQDIAILDLELPEDFDNAPFLELTDAVIEPDEPLTVVGRSKNGGTLYWQSSSESLAEFAVPSRAIIDLLATGADNITLFPTGDPARIARYESDGFGHDPGGSPVLNSHGIIVGMAMPRVTVKYDRTGEALSDEELALIRSDKSEYENYGSHDLGFHQLEVVAGLFGIRPDDVAKFRWGCSMAADGTRLFDSRFYTIWYGGVIETARVSPANEIVATVVRRRMALSQPVIAYSDDF